jgi:phage terminase small subunit
MADHAIPGYLARPSRAWLGHLLDEYEWTQSEWRLAVLAAETYDRAQTARRTLSREGLTILSPRGEIKPHPCVVIARDSTALFSKLVAQLGLDDESEDAAPKLDRRNASNKAKLYRVHQGGR